jgi:hypothetical protein
MPTAKKTTRAHAAPRKDITGPKHKGAKPKGVKQPKAVPPDPSIFTKRGLERDLSEYFQSERGFDERVRDGGDEEDEMGDPAPPSLEDWYVRSDCEEREEYATPPSEDDGANDHTLTLFHRTPRMGCRCGRFVSWHGVLTHRPGCRLVC